MTRGQGGGSFSQGAVVLVNLEPVAGSEQGKVRPCAVVSDLAAVRASRSKPLYLIVPFTRSETLVGPLAPRIPARAGGVPLDSTALVMHTRSVDPARIRAQAGQLDGAELAPILAGLRHLTSMDAQP